MQPQLQDSRNATAARLLEFGEPVQVPRIEDQGLFANRIGLRSQRHAAMCIVQVVGGANCNVIHALAAPAKLVDMAVEALEFSEKIRLGKVVVYNADRILRVERHLEV